MTVNLKFDAAGYLQRRVILNVKLVFRTQNVLGEKGRRIRELTAVVQKRFGFPEGSVEVKKSG